MFFSSLQIEKIQQAKLYFLILQPDSQEDKKLVTKLPYRKILSNPRLLISLAVGYFSAMKWAAIDPILEPELRTKVNIAPLAITLLEVLNQTSFCSRCPKIYIPYLFWKILSPEDLQPAKQGKHKKA